MHSRMTGDQYNRGYVRQQKYTSQKAKMRKSFNIEKADNIPEVETRLGTIMTDGKFQSGCLNSPQIRK